VLFSFVASPSVLWYCWFGLLTCKKRLPYNLYCVGGDVKHCTIQSNPEHDSFYSIVLSDMFCIEEHLYREHYWRLLSCRILTANQNASVVRKMRYSHNRELHCIRHYLDSKTASSTSGSVVHSKLDCCNFLAGSRPTKVVCITVLTGNRMGWIARCGRPPLLLPSCRKLEFRLSALMDSDLAWVNGESGRHSWRYADALQRSIISEAMYHFTIYLPKFEEIQ